MRLNHLVLAMLFSAVVAHGQQTASSITQSRLFTNPAAPGTASFDANGNALPDRAPASSEDNSFGTQIVLKNQERPKIFSVFGDASVVYTNNADLTPHGTRSDAFLAATAGAAWRPPIWHGLALEISAASSVFRYESAEGLDFERISAGTGLAWIVPRAGGIIAFTRYDFTELLGTDSKQLVQDHAFTLGGQKTFVFGRSHFLTTGVTGVLGRSTPRSQERDQAGAHAAYHLQITRSLGADLLYRYAAEFYREKGRLDHNQTLSLSVGFSATQWLRIEGSISAARNESNRSSFDYDVLNLGSGLRFGVRF